MIKPQQLEFVSLHLQPQSECTFVSRCPLTSTMNSLTFLTSYLLHFTCQAWISWADDPLLNWLEYCLNIFRSVDLKRPFHQTRHRADFTSFLHLSCSNMIIHILNVSSKVMCMCKKQHSTLLCTIYDRDLKARNASSHNSRRVKFWLAGGLEAFLTLGYIQ